MLIRRRYTSKKDFYSIFKQWNKSSNGELSISEVKEMLNKFGISINSNETKVLLSTGSIRGKETLNLNEFIQFLFPEEINFSGKIILIKVINKSWLKMKKLKKSNKLIPLIV